MLYFCRVGLCIVEVDQSTIILGTVSRKPAILGKLLEDHSQISQRAFSQSPSQGIAILGCSNFACSALAKFKPILTDATIQHNSTNALSITLLLMENRSRAIAVIYYDVSYPSLASLWWWLLRVGEVALQLRSWASWLVFR